MSDYRIKITIRNNRLLEALENKGYINNGKASVKKFCDKNNLKVFEKIVLKLKLKKNNCCKL